MIKNRISFVLNGTIKDKSIVVEKTEFVNFVAIVARHLDAGTAIKSSDVVTVAGEDVYIISPQNAYNQINKFLLDEACGTYRDLETPIQLRQAIEGKTDTNLWWDVENNWIAVIGKTNAQNVLNILETVNKYKGF